MAQTQPQAHPFGRSLDPVTMAERIIRFAPASDAELLKLLRVRFPDCPLSTRVAALDYLMRRRPYTAPYSPR